MARCLDGQKLFRDDEDRETFLRLLDLCLRETGSRCYAYDNKKHKLPHIHAAYQEFSAVFNIDDSELLEGELPKNKTRLVQAWIEIHREDLLADWRLSVGGQQPQQIKPLE